MSILVTGVGTILGAPLVRRLVGAGIDVDATFRTRNDWVRSLGESSKLNLIQADLSDRAAVDQLVRPHHRAIIHLAATSPRPGVTVERMVIDNIDVTRNVIRAAAEMGAGQFILMSSMSVYGTVSAPSVDERTPIVSPGAYGTSKLMCEQLLQSVADRMSAVAIRLPALLGAGAHRHWLAKLVETAKSGAEVTAFNPGARFNNGVHVSDVVELLAAAVAEPRPGFEVFPVASSGAMSIREVVGQVVTGLASTSPVRIVDAPMSSFTIDFSRARDLFRYQPLTIQQAVERYVRESR